MRGLVRSLCVHVLWALMGVPLKILWIGDAACDSGFSKCTHNTLPGFVRAGDEVVVLGLNYRGDPHPYPYKIYPAYIPGGDLFGVKRIVEIVGKERPDVVVIQNDPWNIPAYVRQFDRLKKRPFLVGAIAVDGKNCRGGDLNGLDHAIFWTRFADDEARKGGFTKTSSIVPLGVDLDVYTPGDRHAAREALGLFEALPNMTDDSVIVLNVNRNQPRKRLDLTLQVFADYYHTTRPDAYLYLHVCPTGDIGYDVDQLSKYYELKGRVILAEPGVYHGSTDAEMVQTYRAATVGLSTTQGEGWGLTTMEGMACGLPQIVPDWSALGEWAYRAAYLIPCSTQAVTPNKINVIGGLPDVHEMVQALVNTTQNPAIYETLREKGLALVADPQYRWDNIADKFAAETAAAI